MQQRPMVPAPPSAGTGYHQAALGDSAAAEKERFLKDLARVVPALSSSSIRSNPLLQSILQESHSEGVGKYGGSNPSSAPNSARGSDPKGNSQYPGDLTSCLLKSLLQGGGNNSYPPAANTVQDPAIKQRSGPRLNPRGSRYNNYRQSHQGMMSQTGNAHSSPPVPQSRQNASYNPAPIMPSAEALVAQSLLRAQPSPFQPPKVVDLPDLTELNWDEEGSKAHWPVDDEAIFYRSDKLEPSAEQEGIRQYYDFNIVMPLIIPNAEIRVLNPDGENYYNLAQSNPGAHLLFGRETRIKPNTCGANALSGTTGGREDAATVTLESDDPDFEVSPPSDHNQFPAVCDVWATFLNVHLGTIRNCRANQVVEVCQLFNQAFSEDEMSHFMVPITVDCQGIYPVPKPNSAANDQPFERYETKGSFHTDLDRRRFRIIRRRLKRFVLMLWDKYGVTCDGHKFDVALGNNCRSRPSDSFHIEIRRYGALSHPQLLKHIYNTSINGGGKGTDLAVDLPDLPSVPAQARVVLNELRLEMTHARMVDPRWPRQWVLARRMPAIPASSTKPPVMARFVFCSRVEMPRILYEFNNPKKALLKSRFSPLYLLADVSRKDAMAAASAAAEEKEDLANKTKLSASAVPFFPLSAVLNKLGKPDLESSGAQLTSDAKQPSAWERLVTSATMAGVMPDPTVQMTNPASQTALNANSLFTATQPAVNKAGNLSLPFNATTSGLHHSMPGLGGDYVSNATSDLDPFFARLSPNTTFNITNLLSPPSASRLVTDAAASPSVMVNPLLRKTPYSGGQRYDHDGLPITEEPCKFYRSGECIRGDSCYFLHPADPQLENRVDIRHLSPANPIFF